MGEQSEKEAYRIRYEAFGPPEEVLRGERMPVEPPGQGEVLVRMLARPVNPSDLLPVRGVYAHRTRLPGIPGYEGVGIVEETGPGVPRSLLGRRVLPLRGEGTWQELVRSEARWAVPVPDWMEDETAAQLYINPLTAWLVCTEVLALRPGDPLVVNAGGSALGRLLAQLAPVLGYRLFAAVRSSRDEVTLLALGASRASSAKGAELLAEVREWTEGEGAAAAIDSVGGDSGAELAACVRPGGTVLALGLLSGQPVDWASVAQSTGVRPALFHLRHWNARVTPAAWHGAFEQLALLLESGRLALPPVGWRYPLREFREALRAEQARAGRDGKVLLTR
ncbi:alcohol dehydrogenase [Paenibacillus sp. J31TS4]|uniref:zinc-dependent alcohol dehydrogenase family protein n=1 Tax=Paenibacillus sp. J31TS4 TaxID=2807195 RepID=UPI001B10DB8A|nr:zinc-dependent alcohol dehydrogenase family protein [Paenibacillus sp. J31TS4]GIP38409.1 alcohol dehydrogenase [Paenibacillus sp. J31TS4]